MLHKKNAIKLDIKQAILEEEGEINWALVTRMMRDSESGLVLSDDIDAV